MIAFAALLERLVFATATDTRLTLLRHFFATSDAEQRGLALGVLTGAVRVPTLRPAALRGLAAERADPVLLRYAHEFVGDLTETIALMWPAARANAPPPSLREVVDTPRDALPAELPGWLDRCEPSVRLALLKLLTGGGRPIVSGPLARAALAAAGGVAVTEVEAVWHGQKPPYAALFAWLDGAAPAPAPGAFRPFMLAGSGGAADWVAEPLWAGERVLIADGRVFSREAEDISAGHTALRLEGVVLDGVRMPDGVRLFDMLAEGSDDLHPLPFLARRQRLEAWFAHRQPAGMALSPLVPFGPDDTGLILKHPDSPYVAGRAHGFWAKRPRPPNGIEAVVLYVEDGFYTVGLWRGDTLLPVGQAPAPFLDAWVRDHTIARFGPVREVEKSMVVSVTFTHVRRAPRRKAGVILDGLRIGAVLPNRTAAEAGRLDAVSAAV